MYKPIKPEKLFCFKIETTLFKCKKFACKLKPQLTAILLGVLIMDEFILLILSNFAKVYKIVLDLNEIIMCFI